LTSRKELIVGFSATIGLIELLSSIALMLMLLLLINPLLLLLLLLLT